MDFYRSFLIENILAWSSGVFTRAALQCKSTKALEKIYDAIPAEEGEGEYYIWLTCYGEYAKEAA